MRKNNSKDLRSSIYIFYIGVVAFIFLLEFIQYSVLLTTINSTSPIFQQTINRIIICVLYMVMALVAIDFKYKDLKVERTPDTPIDVIGFDGTKIIRDILIAIGLTASLIFLSTTMKIAMIGVPGAVTGIMAFGGTAKLLLTMAVAPIENIVIAGIFPATILTWLRFTSIKFKLKGMIWDNILIIFCALIGGGLGVALHSVVYPATMAYVQLATFFFFSLGTWVVLKTKSMLAFDLTHIGYNLSIAFFLLLPYTLASII